MLNNHQFLLIVLLLICSFLNAQKNDRIPRSMVYKQWNVISSAGMSEFQLKIDSLVESHDSNDNQNKNMLKELLIAQIEEISSKESGKQIHLEINEDTIWRHESLNGKMHGDYIKIIQGRGELLYYDKSKSINYRKHQLFNKNVVIEIETDKESRVEILGIDCYKMKLIVKDEESDFGDTIYEMYVTDQIDLPIHVVSFIPKYIPGILPMRIKVFSEKMPGMSDHYQIISIE